MEIKLEQLRDQLFPGSANEWDRNVHDGYSTVPRTIGLMLTLLEELADKGKHVSRVYSELWFRTTDCKLIEVDEDESDLAHASGLSARRWKERIDILEKLGFIKIAPNGAKKYGYIFLPNPNDVTIALRKKGQVSNQWWGAYAKRCSKIGYKLPT